MRHRFNKYPLILLIAFLTGSFLSAQNYVEGESYFGRNNYIEYMCGGLPLIISVPHGGYDTPGELPDRTCGTTVSDSYTLELSQELRDEIFKKTGRYPHMIINHLKRLKLDPNREVYEATCGNALAEISWEEYQKFIDSAKVIVTRDYQKGFFIDLHGQSSHGERIELGYLLSGTELQLSDFELNSSTYEDKSSIRSLVANNINGITFTELLRGDQSLGTMLENEGYTAVPSLYFEFPTDAYFSGGYNTDRHGSKSGGMIDGVQMECNRAIRFNEYQRQDFAYDLSTIVLAFLKEHYFTNLEDFYDPELGADDVINLPGISIFPNPVKDFIHISVADILQVEIYNLYGQVVYSELISGDSYISLSHLKKGMYILVARNKGEVIAKEKLIISLNK